MVLNASTETMRLIRDGEKGAGGGGGARGGEGGAGGGGGGEHCHHQFPPFWKPTGKLYL